MPSSLAVHHTRHEICGTVSRVTPHNENCDTGHADTGASGLFLLWLPTFVLFCLLFVTFVKLRQGSGKDRQGMAVKAKGLNTTNTHHPKVSLHLTNGQAVVSQVRQVEVRGGV